MGLTKFVAASLIFHREATAALIPSDSPLRTTILFKNNIELPSNTQRWTIDVLYPHNNKARNGQTLIELRGIPPQVMLMEQVATLQRSLDGLAEALEEDRDKIIQDVSERVVAHLNDRGIGGGNISVNDLGGLFQDRLIPLETRLEEMMAAVAANAAMNPPPPPATPPPLDQTEVEHYFWGSHPDEVARTVPRKLPETFDLGLFTNMTILLVWQAWHFGIGSQRMDY